MAGGNKGSEVSYQASDYLLIPVEAAVRIYRHSLVAILDSGASASEGYAIPAAHGTSNIGSFVGVAQQEADNSSGSRGDKKVLVRRTGRIRIAGGTAISGGGTISGTFAQTNVGDDVYIGNAQTASADEGVVVGSTSNLTRTINIGKMVKVVVGDTAQLWVEFNINSEETSLTTHINDSVGAHAAAAISFTDSQALLPPTEVDAALEEVITSLYALDYNPQEALWQITIGGLPVRIAPAKAFDTNIAVLMPADTNNGKLIIALPTAAAVINFGSRSIGTNLPNTSKAIVHMIASCNDTTTTKCTAYLFINNAGLDHGDSGYSLIAGFNAGVSDSAWAVYTATMGAMITAASPNIIGLCIEAEANTDANLLIQGARVHFTA